jgi:hypothetical protein
MIVSTVPAKEFCKMNSTVRDKRKFFMTGKIIKKRRLN